MTLKEITGQLLKPLARISPNRFFSLQQCRLRGIWAANGQPPLLPRSPSARLGTAVHELLKHAFQGQIVDEESLVVCWKNQIQRQEGEMLENPLEEVALRVRTGPPERDRFRWRDGVVDPARGWSSKLELDLVVELLD